MTTATPATPAAEYSISDVSARTGLSAHTLRFYEKEDLFASPIRRDAAGRRIFGEQEVEWLLVCSKLRATGMPLPTIRRYVELFREGPRTVRERFELLREHEAQVRRQVDELSAALATIEHKVAYYARRLDDGTADQVWTHGPEC